MDQHSHIAAAAAAGSPMDTDRKGAASAERTVAAPGDGPSQEKAEGTMTSTQMLAVEEVSAMALDTAVESHPALEPWMAAR